MARLCGWATIVRLCVPYRYGSRIWSPGPSDCGSGRRPVRRGATVRSARP